MSLRNYKSIEERRKFIEKKKNLHLEAVSQYPQDLEQAQFNNCENMIGAVSVPLGIAGPLNIKRKDVLEEYYIPLATTEGALVASVNRGCKAVLKAGGVTVFTENTGITRGPVFRTDSLSESLRFRDWIKNNFEKLQQIAKRTSSHLNLLKFDTMISGRNVYARFCYDTRDAMGMNMVTIATQKVADYVLEKAKVRCIALAGNFDIDKKPAWLNFISGRGWRIWAEAIIDKKIVKEVLKTTPEKIHEVAVNKCLLGSILSGSLGFNAHYANIVAAIFIACGQDAAHVTEGSLGITTTDIIDGNLYISILLPDLPVGTVGGGTGLPAQKEALNILGLAGGRKGKNAKSLAEVTGGAVLAGELSLLASLSAGTLASSHERFARNKLVR